MKIKSKIIIILVVLMVVVAVSACSKNNGVEEEVKSTPTVNVIIDDSPELSDPVQPADDMPTPGIEPDESMEEEETLDPEELVEAPADVTDLEEILDMSEATINYMKNENASYINIDVRNRTKTTLRGGMLIDLYDSGTLVITIPVFIEDSDDSSIKSGSMATLFAEVEGRDCVGMVPQLRSDPQNPLKPVS